MTGAAPLEYLKLQTTGKFAGKNLPTGAAITYESELFGPSRLDRILISGDLGVTEWKTLGYRSPATKVRHGSLRRAVAVCWY